MPSFSRFRASGGKSGVHFYKTNDDRFLLKELSRQEAKDFNVFAHKYLNYIREARDKNQPTLLAKIVGKNADTNLLLKNRHMRIQDWQWLGVPLVICAASL